MISLAESAAEVHKRLTNVLYESIGRAVEPRSQLQFAKGAQAESNAEDVVVKGHTLLLC